MGAKSGDRLTIFIFFFIIIIVVEVFSALPMVSSSSSLKNDESSQDSLNTFLYSYALNAIPKPRTGRVYEVPPPANLSGGGGVTLLRLRTHRLWKHGLNLTTLKIPPTTALPSPFTRRVDFVYQNLGNWSTLYYTVPNYTLVAPVIGLLAYDSGPGRPVGLEMRGGNPITVRFNNVSQYDAESLRCVWFAGGAWQLSNVSGNGSACEGSSNGHFSIVAPTRKERKKKKKALRWWVVGIPVAAAATVVIGGVVWWKVGKWRRERRMEITAERSEGLNQVWIGRSRMFTASAIRTQPILETTFIP